MKSKSPRHVKIKTTSEKITSRSGLLLAEEFIRRLDARKILDDCLSVKKRKRGYSESGFITSCALNLIDGASCLSDMDRLKSDGETLDLLGIDDIPHSTTMGDFFDKFYPPHIRQLEKALQQIGSRLHEIDPARDITVDVDSIVLKKYGSQQGIGRTYRKTNGLHPQFAFRDDTGECVFARLQRGNSYSSSRSDIMFKTILKALPEKTEIYRFRADSAWYMTDFFEMCEERASTYYYITAVQHGALLKSVHALSENEWKTYNDYEEVAEFQYKIKSSDDRRFIVKRRHVAPQSRQHIMDFARYHYHIIVTNDDEKSPRECMRFATGRCNVENRLKEMVHGLSLNHLPGHDFIANWAYMLTVVLAYNLGMWMRSYAFPESHKKISFKTLRYRFLHVAGRVCHSGRQIWLALKKDYYYYKDFVKSLQRIREIRL